MKEDIIVMINLFQQFELTKMSFKTVLIRPSLGFLVSKVRDLRNDLQ